MKEVLEAFNKLMLGHKGVAIIKPEDKTPSSTIRPGATVEEFMDRLQMALLSEETTDDLSLEIIGAEAFDYGYEIELKVKRIEDGDTFENKYTLYHAAEY